MFKQYNFENNVKDKCSLKAVTLMLLLLSFFFHHSHKKSYYLFISETNLRVQNNLHN